LLLLGLIHEVFSAWKALPGAGGGFVRATATAPGVGGAFAAAAAAAAAAEALAARLVRVCGGGNEIVGGGRRLMHGLCPARLTICLGFFLGLNLSVDTMVYKLVRDQSINCFGCEVKACGCGGPFFDDQKWRRRSAREVSCETRSPKTRSPRCHSVSTCPCT
jgi:hypothetical protein